MPLSGVICCVSVARTLLLLLLFLICFAWMSVLLMLFLGYRIKVRNRLDTQVYLFRNSSCMQKSPKDTVMKSKNNITIM